MKKMYVNLLTLLVVLIIFFLIGEMFLRLINYAPYDLTPEKRGSFLNILQKSEIKGLGYELKPNVNTWLEGAWIETNSQGLRENKEYSFEKPINKTRIETYGDSITMGQGVNLSYIYPELLNSDKYEVLNFGVTGYNTEQEVIALKEKGLKYKPDIIIMEYFLNDVDNKVPYFDKTSKYAYYKYRFTEFLMQKSYLYTFVRRKWINIVNKFGRANNWISEIKSSYANETIMKKEEMFLDKLKQIGKENNLTIIFVNHPLLEEPFYKDYLFLKENQIIKKMIEERDFIYIDLLEDYRKVNIKNYINSVIDVHPNAKGHKLIADLIFDELIKSDYFPNESIIKQKYPLNENFINVIRLN